MTVKENKTAVSMQALEASGLKWRRSTLWLVIIVDGIGVADFWPTTGRWRLRNKARTFGFDMDSLVEHVNAFEIRKKP
jgi:hypothetical protein